MLQGLRRKLIRKISEVMLLDSEKLISPVTLSFLVQYSNDLHQKKILSAKFNISPIVLYVQNLHADLVRLLKNVLIPILWGKIEVLPAACISNSTLDNISTQLYTTCILVAMVTKFGYTTQPCRC